VQLFQASAELLLVPVEGAVVPGLCRAAPPVRALFRGACDESLRWIECNPRFCEKGVLTNVFVKKINVYIYKCPFVLSGAGKLRSLPSRIRSPFTRAAQ
jgi:hypothetical protein